MKTKLEKCKVIASDMNIANYLNFKHDDNFIRKIEKIIGQECSNTLLVPNTQVI